MCKGNYAYSVKLNMPLMHLFANVYFFTGAQLPQYTSHVICIFSLTNTLYRHNYLNILFWPIICFVKEDMMSSDDDTKAQKLKKDGILNLRPEQVKDELFQQYDFFDPRDLLQVKYEMIRRVQKDSWTVMQASKTFGFSRPSYYEAQNSFNRKGLPGLIPGQRGPKSAHKLSDHVMEFVEEAIAKDSTLHSSQIALLLEKRFDLKVHPRSIERAMDRRKKKEKKKINEM